MSNDNEKIPPQRTYGTIGGLRQVNQSAYMQDDDVAAPEPPAEQPPLTNVEAPPPIVVSQPEEPAQAAEPTPAVSHNVIQYNRPDGTVGELELPDDIEEAKKLIGNLASGRDAYEMGKKILKDKDPELAGEWRQLLKQNQEIIKNLAESKQATATTATPEPASLMTDDQNRYYKYLMEDGRDVEADAYFRSVYANNMMIFNQQQAIEEMRTHVTQMAGKSVLDRNVNTLRQLDPTLPDPDKHPQEFMDKLNGGYAGFLKDKFAMNDQSILMGNLDHATIYQLYTQTFTNQAQSQKSVKNNETTPPANAGVANANVSQSVLKTMLDVSSGGAGSTSIGGAASFEKYKDLDRKAMSKVTRGQNDPFVDKTLEELGLGGVIKRAKRSMGLK